MVFGVTLIGQAVTPNGSGGGVAWFNEPVILLVIGPAVVALLSGFIAFRQQRVISRGKSDSEKLDEMHAKIDTLADHQHEFKEALARHELNQLHAAERASEKFADLNEDLQRVDGEMKSLASKVESDNTQIHTRMDRLLERLVIRAVSPDESRQPRLPRDWDQY